MEKNLVQPYWSSFVVGLPIRLISGKVMKIIIRIIAVEDFGLRMVVKPLIFHPPRLISRVGSFIRAKSFCALPCKHRRLRSRSRPIRALIGVEHVVIHSAGSLSELLPTNWSGLRTASFEAFRTKFWFEYEAYELNWIRRFPALENKEGAAKARLQHRDESQKLSSIQWKDMTWVDDTE